MFQLFGPIILKRQKISLRLLFKRTWKNMSRGTIIGRLSTSGEMFRLFGSIILKKQRTSLRLLFKRTWKNTSRDAIIGGNAKWGWIITSK